MSEGPTTQQRIIADAMVRAMDSWRAGRLAEAEDILNRLLQRMPEQADAQHLLGVVLHQSGRTEAGIEAMKRALSASPDSAPFHANIAKLYRALGDMHRAIEHGERSRALNPQRVDVLVDLGTAMVEVGEARGALARFDAALRLRPNLAEAVNGRGAALLALGEVAEAESECRRALTLKQFPEALNTLGTALRRQGRGLEAEAVFRRALALKPDYLSAAINLVLTLKDLGRFEHAMAIAQQVLQLAPKDTGVLTFLGAFYFEIGQTGLALATLNRSLAVDPNRPDTLDFLGRVHAEAGRTDLAIAAYRRAIELRPAFADAHTNLGDALRDLGEFDGAIAEYEASLKLEPDAVVVYASIVAAKKFRTSDDPHLRAMEALTAQIDGLPSDSQARLHFALGKAYDDLERYDEAFVHFAEGNALVRKSVAYDEGRQLGFFTRVQNVFTPELIAAKSGTASASALPIFVVGMPRSGTTLVEQLIAGHSRVKGAGETLELDIAIANVRGGDVNAPIRPEIVADLSGDELTQIGDDYVRGLMARVPDAPQVVDKLPVNFHHLGLIHLALPKAKIVHIKRNALDTCFSCFSTLFTGEQNHTYDLAKLGRYWRAYDALMAHWRRVLPAGAFLDVEYERLVGDLEGEARRIFAYCGLDWEPDTLAFERRKAAVRTASAFQVRQPLYTSAVARWRNYERHLGPLIEALELRAAHRLSAG